jgi:hypothetical protein
MAAAAGVTAGLGSMAAPDQALARTPASAVAAADTLPKAKLTAPAKATAAKTADAAAKKSEASSKKADASAKKADASAKAVVATATSNEVPKNDACGDEADCRNINGAGW